MNDNQAWLVLLGPDKKDATAVRPWSSIERLYWLIRLRWIAVVSVIFAVSFSEQVLKLSLPRFPLYAIAFLLASYNSIFFLILNYLKKRDLANLSQRIYQFANLQISFDFTFLAILIHFSGGIENPFIFYFIFHMIIASILLYRKDSFLQATFAVFLFGFIVILEYLRVLPHYCLRGFIISDQFRNLKYIGGTFFVFMSTLYIAVYMATSITKRLRGHEKQLRQANELLKEKEQIKSEYVLRVSHDIKEHLSAIQGCLEPVTTEITGPLNDAQKDLLRRAEQRMGKLIFFVRALLEITRIKLSKHIEMEYFSLAKTVENAINFVQAKAKDKGIRISCTIEPTIDKIKGAQIYIEETIANILANSVKYTPQKGAIEVSVKDKFDLVLIRIEDTGIGIPKDEIKNIFSEFFRASNVKEVEKTGTGLGLAIAKQVVERHKGKIWAESEEGKGSAFNIILPK